MGEESEKQPEKKPAKWSPFRLFEWIDSHPSESRRRITQNLISGLIVATILAICGIVWNLAWTHKDILTRFSKWSFDLLQSPIQLQLWILLIVLIMLFGFAWIIYWIRGKNKKIAELEAKVEAMTPRTTDEILADLWKKNEPQILRDRREKTEEAINAIYEKLLPMLNLWQNCTELMEDEAEKKLKFRLLKFRELGAAFSNAFESNKLKITDEQLLEDILTIANKMQEFVNRMERANILNRSNQITQETLDSNMLPIGKLEIEIPQLRIALEKKIRKLIST
jgi:hypothetical protein